MWSEIPKKLWDLANVITGFSVAQAIAFLYASIKVDLNCRIHDAWIPIALAIFVFHLCYGLSVFWCHKKIVTFEGEHRESFEEISSKVCTGQLVVIAVFGLFALFVAIRIGVTCCWTKPLRGRKNKSPDQKLKCNLNPSVRGAIQPRN